MHFVLSSATVPSTIERSTRIVCSPWITSSLHRPRNTGGFFPRTITLPDWCLRLAIELSSLLAGSATLADTLHAAAGRSNVSLLGNTPDWTEVAIDLTIRLIKN